MGDDTLQRLGVTHGEIEYTDHGTGDPILLVHGGVFADWFVPLQQLLLDRFRVIRMRRAGYVPGAAPSDHLSLSAHADHCAELLDRLDTDAHVVGHSSSALIAVELAAARHELVSSLLLIEPPLGGGLLRPEEAEVMRPLIEAVVQTAAAGDVATAFDAFMSAVCGSDYRKVLEATLGAEGLATAEHDSGFFFASEVPAVLEWVLDPDTAIAVSQPALLVQGGTSPPIVHDVTTRLAALLPRAEVTTVDGSDHMLPLRDPAALGRLISEFVRRA